MVSSQRSDRPGFHFLRKFVETCFRSGRLDYQPCTLSIFLRIVTQCTKMWPDIHPMIRVTVRNKAWPARYARRTAIAQGSSTSYPARHSRSAASPMPASACRTPTPSPSLAPASTSSTPTRYSSTWPTRCRHCARWPGSPARAASSQHATATAQVARKAVRTAQPHTIRPLSATKRTGARLYSTAQIRPAHRAATHGLTSFASWP